MDGVIAAAMLNAKTRTSTSGTTSDVSENLTPPLQKNSESILRKPKLTDASSLEVAHSTTLLNASAPAQRTVDSDSVIDRKKARARKSHAKGSLSSKSDNSSLVSSVHGKLGPDSSPSPFPLKNGAKLSIPSTTPPPNQKTTQRPSPVKAQREEESTSEDEDSDTPKKKPAPVTDPDDELDAFLHAPTNSSQKSVLENLPSDSEAEEEEAEREDVEIDEEGDVPKSKGVGYKQLKARTESSSTDSDSESVAADALVNTKQVGMASFVCCVKLTVETGSSRHSGNAWIRNSGYRSFLGPRR